MLRPPDFADLLVVAAVARERSFRRAAAALGLSPSALSHAVRAAEARLGARLLNRTTRSVALTEAGAALLARVGPALAEIEEAVGALRADDGAPRGTVRVSAPRVAAQIVLEPALGRFALAHPGVTVEVAVDDTPVDIVAGGLDAGLRLRESVPGDMVAVPVTGPLRGIVVAAPAYLQGRAAPLAPDDLRGHRLIAFRLPSGGLLRWEFERRGEAVGLAPEGAVVVNDLDLAVAAALDGAGLACVTDARVQGHLAAGRLVALLDEWCRPYDGFCLYYPRHRVAAPALRALADALRWTG